TEERRLLMPPGSSANGSSANNASANGASAGAREGTGGEPSCWRSRLVRSSRVVYRMGCSMRLDAYFALLGPVRWPHHSLVLHHFDDLGRSVVADSQLALKPGRRASLRLGDD